MKIQAYFLFPEDDEDFLRIGDDPQSYVNLIDEVVVIKQQLRIHKDFELCYDSANVKLFLTKAESLINEKYLANCRTQLQILFNSFSRNISTTFLRKTDCHYVNWNINCTVVFANKLLSEVSEAKLHEGQDKTILINISNAYATNRDSVHVIKDAIHYNELPQMATVPVANNEVEFAEWYSSNINQNFSIRDKTVFTATPFIWVKQRIYKKISDGNYWYFDFYHKDNNSHYEVFDHTGTTHLGEANTVGVLDTSKASATKRIDDRIR